MPFLGTTPTQGFVGANPKQSFTANGSTTVFTLTHPVANANDLEVFVGNVRQEPTAAYSAAGTTLTMTEAPATGLNFYVINKSQAQVTTTPPVNSISTDKIVASAVTDAKIAGMASSKLTGAIDVARVPAGTAIQLVNSASGTNYNINADGGGAATAHGALSNYYVSITPLRTGSRFKVDGKVSTVGFANTGSGQGAIYTLLKYAIAGGTVTAAGIDTGHYGNNNTYANHVVSGLTGALSYTLGQSIEFQLWGYGQYFTSGQYAWNRVGGGSGLTITEIAQ